jgi:hypothetical protein
LKGRLELRHAQIFDGKSNAGVYAESGAQRKENDGQANDAERVDELDRSLPSRQRWSTDPFDSFPIKMQPYMHELLNLCKSTASLESDQWLDLCTTFFSGIIADASIIDVFTLGVSLVPNRGSLGIDPTEKLWVPLALTDPALLGAILLCSHQFEARMKGQKERASAINHLKQTVQIPNERLRDLLQEIWDSTIPAMAGLALIEVRVARMGFKLTDMFLVVIKH